VAEVCNTPQGGLDVDDNCNGIPDSVEFDTQNNVYHCGYCNHNCNNEPGATHASARCEGGVCKFTCLAGYYNLDGLPGCEYACTFTGVEVCDGLDNDCNGVTDDAVVSPGNFCRQLGACAGSSPSCGTYTPAAPPETGDNLNQLAGWSTLGATDINTDEGLLYVTLANSAGTRTVSLYRDPALTDLVAQGSRAGDGLVTLAEQNSSGLSGQVTVTYSANDSSITIAVTIKAWICNYNPATVDLEGLNRVALQESRCDGLDNNCDGSTDEPFFVNHIEGSACQQEGVYGECRGHGLWACNATHDAAVCDLSCPPPTCKLQTAPAAETCDNKDNDCDGVVDNGITDPTVHVTTGGLNFYVFTYEASRPGATASSAGTADHRACSQAGVLPWTFVSYADAADACAASGARLCTGAEWGAACGGVTADTNDQANQLSGWAFYDATTSNTNNGTVYINLTNASGTRTVNVYKDAARTQLVAQGSRAGNGLINLVPANGSGLSGTVTVAYTTNDTDISVWIQWRYPYSFDTYQALTCNGEDYDGIPPLPDNDVLIATAQASSCVTPSPAIYDLSGNAKEWTSQYTGLTPDNTPIVVVRGGAYDTPAIGLRCDFTLSRAAVDVLLPTVGFRCCSPCAPGLHFCPTATVCPPACTGGAFCDTATDFNGVTHCARCVDALNDEANCGGCGVTCGGGLTCVNGVCR
jgi:hypothetical protein